MADPEVADDARGAFTMAEVGAVEEFLADDPRVPATELSANGSGVLALFDDQVASFGVDPVVEAWRHEISEPVRDVSVASAGEAVLLRYGAAVVSGSRCWTQTGAEPWSSISTGVSRFRARASCSATYG